MAVGFTPKYEKELPLGDLSAEQFLLLAIETARQLEWTVNYVSSNGLIAHTPFSMSSWSEEVKLKIQENSVLIESGCTGSQFIDWGKNKANVEKFETTFAQVKDSIPLEVLNQKLEEVRPALEQKENDLLTAPPPTAKDNVLDFFSLFVPRQEYFITPIVINLNIILFIIMVASGVSILEPDTESLLKWGANFRPVTLSGEWWRLLTNCFLHIGILHLLMNMYALAYIGVMLEPYLGKTRFAMAYLLTGLAASVASIWWHDLIVSAGASGAIFGMYGVFLAMLTTSLIAKGIRQALLASIGVFVVFNLVNGLNGGIDNAAHIGGLVSGLFIGYLFVISLKKPENQVLKYLTIVVPAILVFIITVSAYNYIPNNIGHYEKKMALFSENENKAMEPYKLPDSTSNEQRAIAFKDQGLHYWNENLAITKEIDKLDLPEIYHNQNKLLIRYCELRIASYKLAAMAYEENTDKYNTEIESYNRQIEAVLDSFNSKQK